MARRTLASTQLAAYMLDKNLRATTLGDKLGLSYMTIYRALQDRDLSDDTKWRIARELGEEPSTLWPPKFPGRRQPGGSRA